MIDRLALQSAVAIILIVVGVPLAGQTQTDALKLDTGVTSPVLVKDAKPKYPKAAMKAKIQGVVHLEAVVLTNGRVGSVRVVRSLDAEYGLDDEAVRTVKRWRFEPGKKNGMAVPVLVQVEVSFTLTK
jgi:protein TonB